MSNCSKKHITKPKKLLDGMLNGLEVANPGAMKIHFDCGKLLVQTSQKSGCVLVISGGRTGNEPFPSGFVGLGMLSAALYGENFGFPTSDEVSKSIQIIAGDSIGADILLIAPNISENGVNFTKGVENARSYNIKVSSVFIGNDYNKKNSDLRSSPMEAICSTILIFKIAGAMSLEGKSMADIISTIDKINGSMATFEVNVKSFSMRGPVFVLGDTPNDEFADDDIDCSGIDECSPEEDILIRLKKACKSISIEQGNEVAILINNMDPTSEMVQWILVQRVYHELSINEIKVVRIYSGNLVSSEKKVRLQICILKLGKNIEEKEGWLYWLDTPTLAPAWPGSMKSIKNKFSSFPFVKYVVKQNLKLMKEKNFRKYKSKVNLQGVALINNCIESATMAVIYEEDRLNSLEENYGVKHCGTVMKDIAEAILNKLEELPMECPAEMLSCIANLCESQITDYLGLVYAILFTSAIPPLKCEEEIVHDENNLQWAEVWGKAWRSGLTGIRRYYEPKQERKTMVDLLDIACSRYESSPKSNIQEVLLALNSCLPITYENNKIGNRSKSKRKESYADGLEKFGYDAEACAVEVWLNAIIKTINQHLSYYNTASANTNPSDIKL